MTLPLLFHILILLGALGAITLLLYYQKQYSLPEDNPRKVTSIFLILIALLMVISTIFFWLVPWENISEFILTPKNNINKLMNKGNFLAQQTDKNCKYKSLVCGFTTAYFKIL